MENKTALFQSLIQEFLHFKQVLFDYRKVILLSLALSLGFTALYISLGLELIPFQGDFFGADQNEWLTLEWSRYHKGSHANRLLFLEIFGFLRLFSPPISKVHLAIFLNSLFGGFTIFFSCIVFWLLTKKYFSTTCFTLLFGLSMNQLFFSAVPESRSLQALSIVITCLLLIISLQTSRIYWLYWILVGIFSFGILLTNFVVTFLCFAVTIIALEYHQRIRKILEYGGTVVFLSFCLNLVQKKFLGGSYFFLPYTVIKELNYINVTLINNPLLVLKELLNNFLLVNFVSASPFAGHSDRVELSFFARDLAYSALGWIALALWLILFLIGFYKNVIVSQSIVKQILIALILSIFFYLVLHSFYNVKEMYIYTTNYSFLVLLLCTNKSLTKFLAWKIAIVILIVVMGINNLNIMREIIFALKT
ncbi:hypothetical protein IQ264_14815 [Phormidium sp. LEGE 05292]|uniref:hypothetical protein n=1 Tax=[Phormidium] sp. LEGE 05292 TaxID=767427 RepID=UPI001882B4AE|nr:hypothetical protein [Phormidium sp. LEGE 05292]MBE9226697.1 hypothetical protein [Phormidium sp. LEGE 05292]